MRSFLSTLAAAAFLVLAGCLPSQVEPNPPPPAPRETSESRRPRSLSTQGMTSLEPDLRRRLEKTNVPALAAAIISGGRVTAAGVAGVRKKGDSTPARLTDKFHIGSCAKSMTATLAASLVEEGRLSWNTTVAQAFPDFEIHPGYRSATLRHLLSHSAGCPSTNFSTPLWRAIWASKESGRAQRVMLAKARLREKPDFRPGSSYRYSNAGYAIAGAMLEKVTGQDWQNLMAQRIFRPLGMSSAGFRAPASNNAVNQPWGHKGNSTPVKPAPYGDNPDALGPAGTIHCSILDWAKYINYHVSGNPRPLLRTQQAYDYLHQVQSPAGNYALGWNVGSDSRRGRVLHHGGTNRYWYAKVWLAPSRRAAVLVVSNAGTPEANRLVSQTLGYLSNSL